MTRTSCLLLGIALLLLAQPLAGPVAAQDEEHLFGVDFTDAPLEDVLRVLFQDRPYTFTLGPGLEDLRVTITLSNVTFTQALRAVLALHDLTYARSGNVYRIVRDQPELPYPIVRLADSITGYWPCSGIFPPPTGRASSCGTAADFGGTRLRAG
jgi:type II secretory pathway component GspD/PulD (secretin)